MKPAPAQQTSASVKPDCYKCIHRRDLPGDAHSQCVHPAFPGYTSNPIFQIGKRAPPVQLKTDGIVVRGNPHGIRMGWFQHPFNYAPVWLQDCSGFTPKDAESA